MRFILLFLLLLSSAYSLALVAFNRGEAQVNLLFGQIQPMSIGLLLVITMALGVIIGLLLGVQVFKVFPRAWELSRLRKENEQLRVKHMKAVEAASANAAARADAEPPVAEA